MPEPTERDRPTRPSTTDTEAALERDLLRALHHRVEEICDRWLRELVEHLAVRPKSVFPGEGLVDHMPDVVEWLARAIGKNDEVSAEGVEALQETARHWRAAGYTIEETLMHFRILSRLVHEELRRVSARTESHPGPEQSARLAEQLSHGVMLVQAVLVGTYRDDEEQRLEQLASTLAHEIRNPIGAALTGLQTLRVLEKEETAPEGRKGDARKGDARRDDARGGDGTEDDGRETETPAEAVRRRQRTILERMEHSLHRANRMVESVRHLGAVPAEDVRREPLREIVEEIVQEIVHDLDREVADVDVECDDLVDIHVPGDPVRLALHNLVQNALRHAGTGEEPLRVRVACAADEERGRWLLLVEDDGRGIPEQERDSIFRRFRRGRGAGGDGFGLGLSIVRAAALQIGGSVTLESEVGGGSTFTFEIPFEQAQPATAASA